MTSFPRFLSALVAIFVSTMLYLPPAAIADDAGDGVLFGMYIHANSEVLRNSNQMDGAVATILDNGFNLVVPQVRAFGLAYYASAREPLSPQVAPPLTDPLGALIAKAKARNSNAVVMPSLQLLTAHSYYATLSDETAGVLRAHPDWVMVNAQGRLEDEQRQRYLDPTLPAVQDYLVEVVREVAARYDVPGIIIEDLAYPAPAAEWGFSPMAILAYQQESGMAGRPDPNDRVWLEWRREQLTQLVERLRDAVHETRPGAKLVVNVACGGQAPVSTADFPNTSPWRDHGQNWVEWAQDGLADVIVLNNFRRDSTEGDDSRQWVEFAAGLKGQAQMGMNVAGQMNFPTGVASQMSLAQRHGTSLIVLYSLRSPVRGNDQQLYQLLKTAVFTAPRVFKPSGITFVTPAPTAAPEIITTPTAALIPPITVEEDQPATPDEVVAVEETPAIITIIETPATPEGAIPTPEPEATPATAPTPAPALTPDTGGFVLPGQPTPEPAVTMTPAGPEPAPTVERRLPTEIKTDVLYLKNGQVIRGRFIDQLEGKVIFEQESGLQLNIPEQRVEKIERAL